MYRVATCRVKINGALRGAAAMRGIALQTRTQQLSAGRSLFVSQRVLPASAALASTRHFSAAPVAPKINDVEFDTLSDLQARASQTYPNNRLFGTRQGDHFEWITYKQFDDYVAKTRRVLQKFGIGVDDKVAIISNNRVEWATVMYAALGVGGQTVPMYEAQPEHDWKYIIEDSEAKLIFAATPRIFEVVRNFPGRVGKVENVLCFDLPETDEHSYKRWLKEAEKMEPVPISNKVHRDHLATIIYTSGTTGKPKGVELTHNNIASDVKAARIVFRHHFQLVTSLAFLPWAHVFGLTSELHALISAGSAMGIVPSREQIVECLGMVKPDIIVSVPIMFNKVYDSVMKGVSKQSKLKQAIFNYALKTARERNSLLEHGKPVGAFLEYRFKLLDKIVMSNVRQHLGGNLKFMASGGASASVPVLQFFEDIGVPIAEGYGLTETAPMITAGSMEWSGRRLGCVGLPLPGVDVRVVDPITLEDMPPDTDGEVTCCGPNVMRGYWKKPEATKEAFFYRGDKRYFRTGDMGRMVEGKFLKITGRIKEQYKLENGKYVVPAVLEDTYARGPHIAQCFIFGADKPFNVMLVVPNYAELANWAKEHKREDLLKLIPSPQDLAGRDTLELFRNEDFIQMTTAEIVRNGKGCKHYEQPQIWVPIVQPFNLENQMLTPKLSLRRPIVTKNYQHLLDGMYAGTLGHRINNKG